MEKLIFFPVANATCFTTQLSNCLAGSHFLEDFEAASAGDSLDEKTAAVARDDEIGDQLFQPGDDAGVEHSRAGPDLFNKEPGEK